MPHPPTPPVLAPSSSTTLTLVRFATLATVATAGFLALWWVPLSTPPTTPSAFISWWESVDTPAATMSLVRAIGLVTAVWLAATSALGGVAVATRSAAAWRVVSWSLPGSLRRALFASALVAGTSLPAASAAADGDPQPAVLRDLGPAEDHEPGPDAPLLTDVGPAGAEAPTTGPAQLDPESATVADTEVAPETWTVRRGDHLWHVAEETLQERGAATDVESVARYWRELLALNGDAIGADPDLVHPGLVLTLPA